MFTEIEYWPARSSFSLCNRLLGGTFRSSTQEADSRYCNLRNAAPQISAGNCFAFPVSYSSAVCRSANVLITYKSVNCRVTGGQPTRSRSRRSIRDGPASRHPSRKRAGDRLAPERRVLSPTCTRSMDNGPSKLAHLFFQEMAWSILNCAHRTI